MNDIHERFRSLGDLAADQLSKLHFDLTSIVICMTIAEGTNYQQRKEQEPALNAYRTMTEQVKSEARRRGLLYLDACTYEKERKPVPVVPFEVVVERLKELETSVDRLMREVACGR